MSGIAVMVFGRNKGDCIDGGLEAWMETAKDVLLIDQVFYS